MNGWNVGDIAVGACEGALNEYMLRILYIGDVTLVEIIAIHKVDACTGQRAWRPPAHHSIRDHHIWLPGRHGTVRSGRMWRRATAQDLSGAEVQQ